MLSDEIIFGSNYEEQMLESVFFTATWIFCSENRILMNLFVKNVISNDDIFKSMRQEYFYTRIYKVFDFRFVKYITVSFFAIRSNISKTKFVISISHYQKNYRKIDFKYNSKIRNHFCLGKTSESFFSILAAQLGIFYFFNSIFF